MNSQDYEIIKTYTKNFAETARRRGYKPSAGIANPAYPGSLYMGGNTFHYDISGNFPYWGGSGGTGHVPAAPWLVEVMGKGGRVANTPYRVDDSISIGIVGPVRPEQTRTLDDLIKELYLKLSNVVVGIGDPPPIQFDADAYKRSRFLPEHRSPEEIASAEERANNNLAY